MSTLSEPEIIAASIAGFIALFSLFLNLFLRYRMKHLADYLELTKGALDFRRRQLDELYGPLLASRNQCKHIAERLRGIHGPNFHVLDHLPGILQNPETKSLVEVLLTNNSREEELLLTKASLIEGDEYPDSFSRFLGHCGILRSAVAGVPLPELTETDYYPNGYDQEIADTYSNLKKEIDSMLKVRSGYWNKKRSD